jgi:glycosyltransferase involved in cell wall biosynthesis
MPLVTVGLPFFNEAAHLEEAIRSVLVQTTTDFELLLVDDGSTDGSVAIARSFSDPRITFITDGRRRGLPARLNEIVARARAPLVARMDADDVMHPTRLSREMAVLATEPSCDVVGTWAVLVDGADHPFGVVEGAPNPPTRATALLQGVLPHATVVCRRSWLLANPYDETLTRAEDRDLWCRTVTTTRFAVIPECLYVIRVDVDKPTFLASYVEGQRQNRQIFARYGPAFVGRLETARLIATARAKSICMRVFVGVGLEGRLVARRGRAPRHHEVALAREALAAASQRE